MAGARDGAAPAGRRGWLRMAAWIVLLPLAIVVVVAAGLMAYVSFDEEITPETRAMMVRAPAGKVDDRNGYVDFLAMGAPEGQDLAAWGRKAAQAFMAQEDPGFARTAEWKASTRSHLRPTRDAAGWCAPEKQDCLALAAAKREALAPTLQAATNAELLRRYRIARGKPEFTDLPVSNLLAEGPAHSMLAQAAAMVRLDIALRTAGGDLEGAVAELELEAAFHRRILDGGRSLAITVVGASLLSRDLLLASELLRGGGEALAPFKARLLALAEAPISTRSVETAMRTEAAASMDFVSRMRDRPEVLAAAMEPLVPSYASGLAVRYMRQGQTMNTLAGLLRLDIAVAGVPATGFAAAAKAALEHRKALFEQPWHAELSNPVGYEIVRLVVPASAMAPQVSRIHDLEGLRRMVHLQARAASDGIADEAGIAALVAAEAAKGVVVPYTGKPFAFDAATRRLSFETPGTSVVVYELKKRNEGRIAITL